MTENEDSIIIWEAPIIVPPEFRLYYDDKGQVICYTCEKIPGDFIVIDSQTYAEARPDVRVIDGKISTVPKSMIITKIMPGTPGIHCASEDVSIIVDDEYDGDKTSWKLNIYELR